MQDAAGYHLYRHGPASAVFALADGMGGFELGDLASKTAISVCLNNLKSIPNDFGMTTKHLRESFVKANIAVRQLRRNSQQEIGTTLVMGLIWYDQLHIAWLGDTRLYLWRQGKLNLLTIDHTLAQDAIDRGDIQNGDVEDDSGRHILTRYLGRYSQLDASDVETETIGLQEGDVLLMVTDGVTEALPLETLAHYARLPSARKIIGHMIQRIKLNRGCDDATAIIIRVKSIDRKNIMLIIGLLAILASGIVIVVLLLLSNIL